MTRSEAIEFAREQQEIFGGKMGEFLEFVEDALTQITGDDLCYKLSELPSAEPQKGEWIETKIWGGRNYSCSCCRFEFNVDTVMLQPTWHYCPNCGARMESDDD